VSLRFVHDDLHAGTGRVVGYCSCDSDIADQAACFYGEDSEQLRSTPAASDKVMDHYISKVLPHVCKHATDTAAALGLGELGARSRGDVFSRLTANGAASLEVARPLRYPVAALADSQRDSSESEGEDEGFCEADVQLCDFRGERCYAGESSCRKLGT
jgi:hypothetical protein